MPSSLTQTVTVVALSDSEVIKRAWETLYMEAQKPI